MTEFVEVKTQDLTGAALIYVYGKCGRLTESVKRNVLELPQFARFIITSQMGDTVSVPKELLL